MMSSSRPDRIRTALVLLSLAGVHLSPHATSVVLAGEAMNRGKDARIVWIDEEGVRHETLGRKIQYAWFERIHLSAPRKGRLYKDKVHKTKGLPFRSDYIRFETLGTVQFSWPDGEDEKGGPMLLVRPVRGKATTASARDLLGAHHPHPPYFVFLVEGVEKHLPIDPYGPPASTGSEARPRILSLTFSP